MNVKEMTDAELFEHPEIVDVALRIAARQVLIRHKLAGDPIVVWRDGKVVEIPADEIVIPPMPEDTFGMEPQPFIE